MIFKNNLGFVLSVKINAQFKAKDLIIASLKYMASCPQLEHRYQRAGIYSLFT